MQEEKHVDHSLCCWSMTLSRNFTAFNNPNDEKAESLQVIVEKGPPHRCTPFGVCLASIPRIRKILPMGST